MNIFEFVKKLYTESEPSDFSIKGKDSNIVQLSSLSERSADKILMNANGQLVTESPEDGSIVPFNSLFGLSDYQIRRFTGTLDKNGKEIYEGDKVRIAGGEYTIEYSHFRMAFKFVFNEGSWIADDFDPEELDGMEVIE